MRILFFGVIGLIGLCACLSGSGRQSATASPPGLQPTSSARAPQIAPTSVAVGRYGIGCRTYQRPNTVGPTSYLVSDIGNPGVPVLSSRQTSMVKRIRKYIHSENLRFAFIEDYNPSFIVFDADGGPCLDVAPGYWILNDPKINMYYEPGEAPGFIHPMNGDLGTTPGPWMTPTTK